MEILNWETEPLPPDTLPLDWCWQHRLPAPIQNLHPRQGAPHRIDVGYTSLWSRHLWGTQGAVQLLHLKVTIGCTMHCSLQMLWTPQVPGSPLESWHHLWSCACYQWLGESPRVCIVAHLSYCLNKDVFNIWTGSIPFEITEIFLLCLKIKFFYQFDTIMLNL